MKIIKKIIGVLALVIAAICTLGLIYPTHSMTLEEVIKGKSVFAVFGFAFGLLAYRLLRSDKGKNGTN